MPDPFPAGPETDKCVCRLKLKRPQTVKMYRGVLDELYAQALKGVKQVGMTSKL